MMGLVSLSEDEVLAVIRLLEVKWPAAAYHMLKRNCCHFCESLCKVLGVGPVPQCVMNLAEAVDHLEAHRQTVAKAFAVRAASCMHRGCCSGCCCRGDSGPEREVPRPV